MQYNSSTQSVLKWKQDYCKPTYDALPAAELDPTLTLQDDKMNLFSFL